MNDAQAKTILLVGATGLVGGQVLAKALDDPRVDKVIAPTRAPLPAHPKLVNPRIHFDYISPGDDWWACDAVICTLGSTRKKAGSKQNFYRVDHDYPLLVAKLAQAKGAHTYVLNSAMGANARSCFFYNRVKGELERDLAALKFNSLTFVRPGLIAGERDEERLLEGVGLWLLSLLDALLPNKLRPSPVENIAHALLETALEAPAGEYSINAEQLAND